MCLCKDERAIACAGVSLMQRVFTHCARVQPWLLLAGTEGAARFRAASAVCRMC